LRGQSGILRDELKRKIKYKNKKGIVIEGNFEKMKLKEYFFLIMEMNRIEK
jgi:hypothetical protein